MNGKRIKTILFGVGIAFFVPLGAYLFLKGKGHDGHIKLPAFYGIDSIDSTSTKNGMEYDTTYHTIEAPILVNHLGDSVNLSEVLKDKMLVINFFFTSCTTICPKLTEHMSKMQESYKEQQDHIQFISISVDPKTDDVERLRSYANTHSANHDSWWFLTGDKEAIYNFARKELELELPAGTGGAEDFIHPEKFTLVDKYRNIRGYYNGLEALSLKDCMDDMAKLIVERNPIHEPSKRR